MVVSWIHALIIFPEHIARRNAKMYRNSSSANFFCTNVDVKPIPAAQAAANAAAACKLTWPALKWKKLAARPVGTIATTDVATTSC